MEFKGVNELENSRSITGINISRVEFKVKKVNALYDDVNSINISRVEFKVRTAVVFPAERLV